MAARFVIRRTKDKARVEELHARLFPGIPFDGTDYWLVWKDGVTVGFATGRKSKQRGWYLLARAGLLRCARGQGLQSRLIAVRLRRAKALGLKGSLTYTANWNSASLINLLKSGFKVYDPWIAKKKRYEIRDGFTYLAKRF